MWTLWQQHPTFEKHWIEMHLKLPATNHKIMKFNDQVHSVVAKLVSREQEANDLLTYLWKAYLRMNN